MHTKFEQVKPSFTLIVMALLLVSNKSLAQSHTLYCQGCCGCINSFSLSLDSGNVFEITYAPTKKVREYYDGNYGKGTYSIENKILTLNFEDLPTTGVTVQRIADSDSLVVNFQIQYSGDTSSLIGTNIRVDNSTSEPFCFRPYKEQTSTLRVPFVNKRTIFLSFIGLESTRYEFTTSGVYNLKAALAVEAKHKFKKGQQMKFKMHGRSVKSIEGDKLKMVSRNCGCS